MVRYYTSQRLRRWNWLVTLCSAAALKLNKILSIYQAVNVAGRVIGEKPLRTTSRSKLAQKVEKPYLILCPL